MTAPIVRSEAVAKPICEALDLPFNQITRIIIDLAAHSAPVIYVEMFGSSAMLEIDWENALKGVRVIKLSDVEEENLSTN